jgi:hypothetical protein
MGIETDLRDWSRQVLEVGSPHLNGLPPCPYAKKAWLENQVSVIETDGIFTAALKACAGFSRLGKELVVVASYYIPDIEELQEFVDALNDAFPETHCMPFHPDYDAEDAGLEFLTDNNWESATDNLYCMIFIQDLRAVVSASDKLERLGYYAAYPADEYDTLVAARRRRLTNEPHQHGATDRGSPDEESQEDGPWRQSKDGPWRQGDDG